MTRYIIRRILQAIPVLLFISVVVYGLIIISPVDPLAMYEQNPNITPEDMAMLEFRLGLRQPTFFNFRGSSGTLRTDVVLWNKAEASGGQAPAEVGAIDGGTTVAIVDGTTTSDGDCFTPQPEKNAPARVKARIPPSQNNLFFMYLLPSKNITEIGISYSKIDFLYFRISKAPPH